MDIYLLDGDYQVTAVIDQYQSLIWTTRYCSPGDFELYIPVKKEILAEINEAVYVQRDDFPEQLMIIEKIQIQKDIENGNYLIVSGRDLLSFLDYRIIWGQTDFKNEYASNVINTIVKENLIPIGSEDPEAEAKHQKDRYIKGFDIKNLAVNKGEIITAQYNGENVLEKATELSNENKLGLKVWFDRDAYNSSNSYIHFEIYQKDKVDYVFCEENENIQSLTFVEDYTKFKNCAVVFGQGEGLSQWIRQSFRNQGLAPIFVDKARREMSVDATSLSTGDLIGPYVSDHYESVLLQKGKDALNESEVMNIKSYEGTIIAKSEDFRKLYDVGNIVTVEDDLYFKGETRIVEAIECWNENGYTITLTLDDQNICNNATIF